MSSSRFLRFTLILPLLSVALCASCGDEDEDDPSTEREGPEGCYIGAEMRCDCDLDEASCTPDVGTWTPGCTSCIQ